MRTYFDCIPCIVRQALEAVRFVTDDEAIHEQVLREVLHSASVMDLRKSPPVMGQRIHRLIRRLTGNDDPYRSVKQHFNRFAMDRYPELKEKINQSSDPLQKAVRLAIAGNIIDFGVNSDLDDLNVQKAIEHSLTAPLKGNLEDFRRSVLEAQDILYLADNAGEIVFDRLLIEQIPLERITLAVKGSPVINDATVVDAQHVGLTDIVEVIDNGSDAPGTVLEECSEAFKRRFNEADLVIAKGQGNYETLSDVDKSIFFLLKVKCPVIARHIGCEIGSLVIEGRISAITSGKEGEETKAGTG